MNKMRVFAGLCVTGLMVLCFFWGKAIIPLSTTDIYFKYGGLTCKKLGSFTTYTTTGSFSPCSFQDTNNNTLTVYSNSACSNIVSVWLLP